MSLYLCMTLCSVTKLHNKMFNIGLYFFFNSTGNMLLLNLGVDKILMDYTYLKQSQLRLYQYKNETKPRFHDVIDLKQSISDISAYRTY
jgi:D-serine deaminase-like pyridoxal phosphate-dependent protein